MTMAQQVAVKQDMNLPGQRPIVFLLLNGTTGDGIGTPQTKLVLKLNFMRQPIKLNVFTIPLP